MCVLAYITSGFPVSFSLFFLFFVLLIMPKVLSSALRRYILGDSIINLSLPAMAPCPQCVHFGATCIVRRGYKKCGPCTKKNITCEGNFLKVEFDRLSRAKAELRKQSR